MPYFIVILIIIFGLSLLFMGPRNALNAAPIIVVVSAILFFLGAVIYYVLPVILILIFLKLLFGKKQPTTRRKTYYYSNTNNAQDFEKFFRKASQSYDSNQQDAFGGFPGYSVDKSKYYTELGVTKNATSEDIKKAYRSMARKYHPDMANNFDDKTKNLYETKFKKINEAYEQLK